jgi:polyhydroxybutyrate depolymerase
MKPLLYTLVFIFSIIFSSNLNANFAFDSGEKNCQILFGKIRLTTIVDGVEREYFIHVPASYDGSTTVPLVFMLHGTSGDGETFYNAHGWKELAEKENFIAVFPSSMKYKIIDEGENKTITKWNHTPDANWTFQPGEKGQDDIKFLRKVIDEMKVAYNINSNRIYLNGFSNGGSMAAKCAVEMSDVLAAVAGNAASFFIDTTYIPKRKLPVLFQVGNEDYGPGNVGPEVPMSYFDTLLKSENISLLNGKHHRIAQRHIDNFDLQSNYTIEGDSNFALVATFLPHNPGPGTGYEFKYIFVKGLDHTYPNGKNHPFDAPSRHWEWMKQFTLEGNNLEGKKLRIVTEVEEVNREYYIHLPATYDSTKPTPMVMFFHGGGHDGELMYNISGWNDVADTANIIMVYPSSLRYCVIEDGVQQMLSQWNNGHSGNTFCPNQELKDDVLFVNTIMQQMSARFNIDSKRIYSVGFSNGGEFAATRTAIELSDKIAASISCGGGGALPRDTILAPKRKLPVMLMFGNKDDRLLKAVNVTGAVPMGFESLYAKYPVLYFAQVKPYVNSFQLVENNYTIIGDTNNIVAAIFKGLSNKPENIFYNVEVKGLEHEYPNGKNHGLHGATYHWKWLKQYTLDESSTTLVHLNVSNGYGSGQYAAGDTVHIWAAEPPLDKTFNTWTGDTSSLEVTNNWHTTIVMPDRDVQLSASYINLPSGLDFKEELIQGKLSKKTVFSYFPPKAKLKGVVWLYQGSNIRGKAWLSNTDPRHFVDMLVANGYGIITMDAEEVTQQKDFNNNGVLEFNYTFDTINNPDLANVKLVKQYFLNKAAFSKTTPMFTAGFSSGGAFAEISAGIFGWQASLSHNTTGSDFMAQKSKVPHYQNNSQNDNGPNVGMAGNASAFDGYKLYLSRNVPTQWILQHPQPLHPERFDRIEGVSLTQSMAIYNAIEKLGYLDSKNYLNTNPAKLQTDFENNPEKFPALQALPLPLVEDIFGQLNVVYTNHAFRADYNGSALSFLNRFNDVNTAVAEVVNDKFHIAFSPNPAIDKITFASKFTWSICTLNGKVIKKGSGNEAYIGELNQGIYLVVTDLGVGRLFKL